eukprot:516560_1
MATNNSGSTNLNLSLFKTSSSQCKGLRQRCDHSIKIIHALKYYSLLTKYEQSSDTFQNKLVYFSVEIYPSLVEDFIHIIQYHNNDLYDISHLLSTNYDMKCNIKNCLSLQRHYSHNLDPKQDDKTLKYDFVFFRNLFDSIHCYLFHCYDIGLRIKTDETKIENDNDVQFENIREIISEKNDTLKLANDSRFSSGKYKLNINATGAQSNETDDCTYIDGLYSYLTEHVFAADKYKLFIELIFSEEYDTDALLYDIDCSCSNIETLNDELLQHSCSNIHMLKTKQKCICICGKLMIIVNVHTCYDGAGVICDFCRCTCVIEDEVYHCPNEKNNTAHCAGYDVCLQCFKNMEAVSAFTLVQKYAQHRKLSEHSFNVGFRFYYWKYYKNNKLTYELQIESNKFDHSGYETYELYIDPKYSSLRNEILNNKFHQLNINKFTLSLKKAQIYIDTIASKTYYAHVSTYFNVYKVYDITNGKPITMENLLSVILYCDWSDLCTAFSKTFRKTTPYETLSSKTKQQR